MNFFGRKKQSYNSPSAVSATSNHAASAAATRTSTANTVVHLRESIATQEKREAHLQKKIDDLTAEAKAKMAKKDKKGAFSFLFYFRCYCFCYCVYFFCCVAKRWDRYVVKSLGGKKSTEYYLYGVYCNNWTPDVTLWEVKKRMRLRFFAEQFGQFSLFLFALWDIIYSFHINFVLTACIHELEFPLSFPLNTADATYFPSPLKQQKPNRNQ